MLFRLERQTEITLVHAQMVGLTIVRTFVHPTLYTPQLTTRTRHPAQLNATPQVHDRTFKLTFQLVDARVAPATTTHCLEPGHVLVQPFTDMSDPQVHDRLEVVGQARDPFVFSDVLAGCVVLPGRAKECQHAFARHRLVATTANEELVRCVWQVDWHICIQVLHPMSVLQLVRGVDLGVHL